MHKSDQALINKLVKKNNIKYKLLPWKKYCNGDLYFNKKKKYFKKRKPLVLHNNFIVGLEAKINRFKKHGLWFI